MAGDVIVWRAGILHARGSATVHARDSATVHDMRGTYDDQD